MGAAAVLPLPLSNHHHPNAYRRPSECNLPSAHPHPSTAMTHTGRGGSYRKQKYERFYLKLIYDVFIAPVYASAITVGIFALYGSILFSTAFISFRLLSHPIFRPAFLYGGGITQECAIVLASTSSSMISLFLLPSADSNWLATFTGLTSLVMAIFSLNITKPLPVPVDVALGVGAVVGACLYWFYFERDNRTLSKIVEKSYSSVVEEINVGNGVVMGAAVENKGK